MSWGLAIALWTGALIALANIVRLCLTRLRALEQRVLEGRGLSPSLLLAHPLTKDVGSS